MNSIIYKLLLWVFQVAVTIKVVFPDAFSGLEPKPETWLLLSSSPYVELSHEDVSLYLNLEPSAQGLCNFLLRAQSGEFHSKWLANSNLMVRKSCSTSGRDNCPRHASEGSGEWRLLLPELLLLLLWWEPGCLQGGRIALLGRWGGDWLKCELSRCHATPWLRWVAHLQT